MAAYDSNLPIKGAKIEIMQSGGRVGISISLGSNLAAEYREEIASASSLNPGIFVQWMKTVSSIRGARLGVDQAHIGGLWAEVKQPSSIQRDDSLEASATSNASRQLNTAASNAESNTNKISQGVGARLSLTSNHAVSGINLDGMPALKFVNKKSGLVAYVRYVNRNAEDAFAFPVYHRHSLTGRCTGWLYVTRNRMEYEPEGDREHAFNLPKGEIEIAA